MCPHELWWNDHYYGVKLVACYPRCPGFDMRSATHKCCNAHKEVAWVMLDLGASKWVTDVVTRTHHVTYGGAANYYSGGCLKTFRVKTSLDRITWSAPAGDPVFETCSNAAGIAHDKCVPSGDYDCRNSNWLSPLPDGGVL